VGYIYYCFVVNNPNILAEESAQINGFNGTHEGSKSNDDVNSFYANYKTIQFFPKMLNIFKNLKMISIISCELKEIHQSDLKVFNNLVYIDLSCNQIDVIEEELFKFNLFLELLEFGKNKIIHIDPNVFDHLSRLRSFGFFGVPCVNQNIDDSMEQVQEVLKIVKSNCSSSEFLLLENQIKNIKIESNALTSEAFDI